MKNKIIRFIQLIFFFLFSGSVYAIVEIIYRGYTFDKQYFEVCFFEVGKIIGEDKLTQKSNPSFTTSLIIAASYIREFCETSLSSTKVDSFQ